MKSDQHLRKGLLKKMAEKLKNKRYIGWLCEHLQQKQTKNESDSSKRKRSYRTLPLSKFEMNRKKAGKLLQRQTLQNSQIMSCLRCFLNWEKYTKNPSKNVLLFLFWLGKVFEVNILQIKGFLRLAAEYFTQFLNGLNCNQSKKQQSSNQGNGSLLTEEDSDRVKTFPWTHFFPKRIKY